MFPFLSWFFNIYPSTGAIVGRCIMIAVVLIVAVFTYLMKDSRTAKIKVFGVSVALFVLAELLYRLTGWTGQMFAVLLGIPTLILALGILLSGIAGFFIAQVKATK